MNDTTDRMYDLLVDANSLLKAPLVDAERRSAYMAAKADLLAELASEPQTPTTEGTPA